MITLWVAAAALSAVDCVVQPKATIELGSREAGIIAEISVERGDVVRKGSRLARLDSKVEELTTELARVRATSDVDVRSQEAQAQFRQREVDRLESLRATQALSESVYAQTRIEADLARLSVESANFDQQVAKIELNRAQAALERRSIVSPTDGVVVDVMMAPGEYVHEQSQIMTLAQIDPLNVEVYLPVSSYGSIEQGDRAVVSPEEPVGGEYEAVVKVVDSVFDAASRTFGVRLELPNPDHKLPAGLRCTVSFAQPAASSDASP